VTEDNSKDLKYAQIRSHRVTCLKEATRLVLPLQQLKSTKRSRPIYSSQLSDINGDDEQVTEMRT